MAALHEFGWRGRQSTGNSVPVPPRTGASSVIRFEPTEEKSRREKRQPKAKSKAPARRRRYRRQPIRGGYDMKQTAFIFVAVVLVAGAGFGIGFGHGQSGASSSQSTAQPAAPGPDGDVPAYHAGAPTGGLPN